MKKIITVAMALTMSSAFAQSNQSLNDNHFWKQQVAHKPLVNTTRLGGGINKPQSTVYLLDSAKAWGLDTTAMVFNQIVSKELNFVYDANNNNTSYVWQGWNGTALVNGNQSTYTYDVNNNQTSYLQQGWSGTAWVNQYLSTYTYDVNNNRASELDQNWSGTAWVNNKLYTYTYDIHNVLASELIQTWSGTAWVNYGYATTTTDVNNNIISVLIQAWSGSAWGNYGQNAYTYDVSNNNTGELDQNWSGSAWVNAEQWSYTYDVNNNQTSELDQRWNTGTNAWVNYVQNVKTYVGSNPHELSNVRKYWNTSHTTAQPQTDSTRNYYRTVTTGIKQYTNNNVVSIYPNPSNGNFIIEPSNGAKQTMQVYDVNGKMILSKAINGKTTIDASSLNEGVYNVDITGSEGVVNKRLVIVK